MCLEFGPVNSTIQTIWENRNKIISAFERTNRVHSDFDSLNEVTPIRGCLSGVSKREVNVLLAPASRELYNYVRVITIFIQILVVI